LKPIRAYSLVHSLDYYEQAERQLRRCNSSHPLGKVRHWNTKAGAKIGPTDNNPINN